MESCFGLIHLTSREHSFCLPQGRTGGIGRLHSQYYHSWTLSFYMYDQCVPFPIPHIFMGRKELMCEAPGKPELTSRHWWSRNCVQSCLKPKPIIYSTLLGLTPSTDQMWKPSAFIEQIVSLSVPNLYAAFMVEKAPVCLRGCRWRTFCWKRNFPNREKMQNFILVAIGCQLISHSYPKKIRFRKNL